MKNRILSLILAVCMVAALVPALLLPAIAADTTGFTTKISREENWPSYTSKTSFDGFNGNWSVGRFSSGAYAEATFLAKQYNIISAVAADKQWAETGLYLDEGRFILLTGEPYMTGDGPTVAFSFTYNAPYEGKVDLAIESLAPNALEENIPAGQSASMYFAVFVNDTMIFPTENGSIFSPDDFAIVTSAEDITNHPSADALKNVDVNIGDKIHFVAARYNTRYGNMVPVVTYHDGYEVVPSRMAQTYGPSSANWPVSRNLNGIGTLKQTDTLWSLGNYNTADNTFTAYTSQQRNHVAVWAGADEKHIDFSTNNGVVINHSGSLSGSFMFGSGETDLLPAYAGTATAKATVEFSVKESALYLAASSTNAAKSVEAAIDVFVNGEKKGTITVKSDSKGAAKLVNTITGVEVNKGDEIVYAARSEDTKAVKFLNAQPNLIYTNISSFMTKATTEKYDMEMDDATVVVDKKVGLQFNAYATIDTYKDATAANVYLWDATVTGEKTLDNATAVIPMAVGANFAYTAIYDTFSPKEIADTFTAQVVVLKDAETIAQSDIKTFSVADAAQAQYDATFSEAEKNLMAAVMNYGAYAQKYFKYNETNLANKGLPADVATIDIEENQYFAEFTGTKITTDALLTYSDLTAFSLYIEDTISIRLHLDLNEYEKANALDMYFQFGLDEDTYSDKKNGTRLAVDRNSASALIEDIDLSELSQKFYLRFVSQERAASATGTRIYDFMGYTWTYSVESFVARMVDSTEENLPELLCAMMELSALA